MQSLDGAALDPTVREDATRRGSIGHPGQAAAKGQGRIRTVSWCGCGASRLCWGPCFHITPQLRALAQPSHVRQPGASWRRRLPPNRGLGGHPPPLNPPGIPGPLTGTTPLLCTLQLGRSSAYVRLAAALLQGPNSALLGAFGLVLAFFLILCLKLYIVPELPCFMSLFVAVFESWHIFVQLRIYLHYLLNKDYSC